MYLHFFWSEMDKGVGIYKFELGIQWISIFPTKIIGRVVFSWYVIFQVRVTKQKYLQCLF